MSEKATKNLVEQAAALDETADAARAVERTKARKTYRELLARAEKPKRGDAEKLRALLPSLDKALDDVRADLATLAEASDLESSAAQAETFAEKRRAEQRRLEKADAARRQAEKDRDEAYSDIGKWGSREREAKKAGERLERLRTARPDLFGD